MKCYPIIQWFIKIHHADYLFIVLNKEKEFVEVGREKIEHPVQQESKKQTDVSSDPEQLIDQHKKPSR